MLATEQEQLRNEIKSLVRKHGNNRSSLLPVLQTIQKKYSYISEFAMQEIAHNLDIHPVEVYSVISFYSFFDYVPKGKFIIRLCKTISCCMAGKNQVAKQLENDLGIKFGDTTHDKKFTLLWTSCLGMCDQGPALMVNDRVYTCVTPAKVHEIIEECRDAFGPDAMQVKEGTVL